MMRDFVCICMCEGEKCVCVIVPVFECMLVEGARNKTGALYVQCMN